MAVLARALSAAAASALLVAPSGATTHSVAAASPVCSEGPDGATCRRREGAASAGGAEKDQVLLQVHRRAELNSSEAGNLGHRAGSACDGFAVNSRRRWSTTSCRRRYRSAGLPDTDAHADVWKCNEATNTLECDEVAAAALRAANNGGSEGAPPQSGELSAPARAIAVIDRLLGYPSQADHQRKAQGLWCEVDIPPADWELKTCPDQGGDRMEIKVLTYNLFWWRLFDQLGGSNRSAARLIADTSGPDHYDLLAFQECDDRHRVMREAIESGLPDEYETVDGGRAIALAYRKSKWTLLESGTADVGEDSQAQYYGKRAAVWVRLQHVDNGKTVFFMNHHGPLPVGWGGGCTGSATSMNLLHVLATHAHTRDALVVTGDFNAKADSSRIQELSRHMSRSYSGVAMGGVDHIFTNCGDTARGENLGKGHGDHGSDHDALCVHLQI